MTLIPAKLSQAGTSSNFTLQIFAFLQLRLSSDVQWSFKLAFSDLTATTELAWDKQNARNQIISAEAWALELSFVTRKVF